ncbi:MAG: response regulator transcription factor [Clostridiales bacterium]|nr:response regulator transcription factor [Clostridiales bacterium]
MSKILIIEDDISIAEIERDYLEINGFETAIKSDGVSGMNEALRGDYQLILLDLMLPGIDGFTVCRRLREQLDIPILLVTARKEDIDKIRGLGLGADDYIVKPFSPGELVARVQAHIATYNRLKSNERASREITVGSIRINKKSRRVFVKEREIALKNREFELLLFLVENAEMVFDKETLYEKIWGMDAIGDNATVAVHINRLREKLEEDPSNPRYIETVWGAGYRFKI